MSNLGKWSRWYADAESRPYGDTITYQLGADWLAKCELVEDWGCGFGWFGKFISSDRYCGIDGSHSTFADKVVDLEEYTSDVPGIYMRHVIEHNYGWHSILSNALNSFQERMVLVVFTPESDDITKEIGFAEDPGVPDISFAFKDLFEIFKDHKVFIDHCETIQTKTQYEIETIFFLYKKQAQ